MGESSFNDLWVLDCTVPGNESWQRMDYSKDGDLPPEPRSYHQMIAMSYEHCLYIFGGCGADGRYGLQIYIDLNIATCTWTTLSPVSSLARRGGSTMLAFEQQRKIAIIAGFVGHETNDGQVFNIHTNTWDTDHVITFPNMQPRSVCSFVSGVTRSRRRRRRTF